RLTHAIRQQTGGGFIEQNLRTRMPLQDGERNGFGDVIPAPLADDLRLALARGHHNDFPRLHDLVHALGDGRSWNDVITLEEAAVVDAGPLRQFHHMAAAVEGRTRLIEADVSIPPYSEQLQFDTTRLQDAGDRKSVL